MLDLDILLFSKGKEIEPGRKVRLKTASGCEFLAGIVALANLVIITAKVVVGRRGVGVEAYRVRKFLERARGIVLIYQGDAEIQVRISGIRLQIDGLAKASGCVSTTTSLCLQHAKSGVSTRILGVGADGGLKISFGASVVATPGQSKAEIDIGARILWIVFDGALKQGSRFGGLLLLVVKNAQIVLRFGVHRIDL